MTAHKHTLIHPLALTFTLPSLSQTHSGLYSSAGWVSGVQASNEVWGWDKERATNLSSTPDQESGSEAACLTNLQPWKRKQSNRELKCHNAVLFCRLIHSLLSANTMWSWAVSSEWQWTGCPELGLPSRETERRFWAETATVHSKRHT